MKTFENYNTENTLIEIIHPYDLVIKFDFDYYTDHLLFFYKNKYLFSYYKKTKHLNINVLLYNDINNKNLLHILSDFIQKHFNIKYKDITKNSINTCDNINEKFNK